MKKAKDWFEEELSGEPLTQESIIEVLEMIQIEAIEESCKRCAEEAIIKSFKLSKYSKNPRWKLIKDEEVDLFNYDLKTEVSKQSILQVADKLKKEILDQNCSTHSKL